MASSSYTPIDAPSPDELWSPTSTPSLRPPPSSFAFPFQAYPGNPDPGLSIPGISRRRSSLDSTAAPPTSDLNDEAFGPGPRSGSLQDLRKPYAPFMGGNATLSHSPSTNSFYKNSPAGQITDSPGIGGPLPRISSTHSFRAPFLSPTSRPTSSLWSPPAYPTQFTSPSNFDPSSPALPLEASKAKPPLPSTRLHVPLQKSEKPWLAKREPRACTSYFLTLLFIVIGIGAAGYICFVGVKSVHLLSPSQLCIVLDEQFTSGSLDSSTWSQDVSLGGFGNGEFEMTTSSSDNLYLNNDQLYIYPTLTTDTVSNVLDGGNYTLSGCTDQGNNSACTVVSNAQLGAVINPVMSARINTQGKVNITYGKVEFRAKLPRGDWLWPAVWMLPETNAYGAWPLSGEIDILEARGNGPAYPAQGTNFVRSTLNYGPLPTVFNRIYGWYSVKRASFDKGFHTYAMEWDDQFMRFYTDSRLHAMLDVQTTGKKGGFWERAGFPETAQNGTGKVVVNNPYAGQGKSAPFNQAFYLIINLSAGGTSGWFPDNVGGKPWIDASLTAMRDFALAQDTWSATWPSNPDDRAFRIDYVKMWQKC